MNNGWVPPRNMCKSQQPPYCRVRSRNRSATATGTMGSLSPTMKSVGGGGVRYVLHGREVAGALLAAERITAVGGIHNGVIQQQQVGPLRHPGQRRQRGGQMSACGAARGSYAGGVYAQSVGVAAHPCHGVACILDALCGR